MKIYPAIDILNGKCVRLHKGDYSKRKEYKVDALELALAMEKEGAEWIHIIDLNAAYDPKNSQIGLISKIVKSLKVSRVQCGGGVRRGSVIKSLLDVGVSRVIVGSPAVTHPHLVEKWLKEYGGSRIMMAFDVRQRSGLALLATHGWQRTSNHSLWTALSYYKERGLVHCLCTDIERDGTLSGPALSLYGQIVSSFPRLKLQASGGVSRLEDIIRLRELGVSGVIIGKALFERRFTLREALSC